MPRIPVEGSFFNGRPDSSNRTYRRPNSFFNRKPDSLTDQHTTSANSQDFPVDGAFFNRRAGKITIHNTISGNSQTIPAEAGFYKERLGKITNQLIISEYSVTSDRQVLNDRSNARYLINENIRDGVNFDLKLGLESFNDKSETLNLEPCLHPLCKWAIAQEGATLKEVFQGAEFAAWRGTMKRIAKTIISKGNSKDGWTVVAQTFDEIILLSEQSRIYDGNSSDLPTYSGHKFEQYMTTDTPNGRPDTNSPIDTRATFEMMVRSTLSVGSESLSICVGAEIDAFRGEEPIELKTVWDGQEDATFSNILNVLQSKMVGVKSFVIGVKKPGYIVDKVMERSLEDLKSISGGFVGQKTEEAYSFLFTVLSEVKQFLSSHEACEITFYPSRKMVCLKKISREEAKARGNGVTNEFLTRFNL